jgi:hypothetical protein
VAIDYEAQLRWKHEEAIRHGVVMCALVIEREKDVKELKYRL